MSQDVLKRIRVASPCPVPWTVMYGDEKVRYCRHCRLHVYNFAEMTRAEVRDRLEHIEGRTCVTFFQRKDGTLLTKDCPLTRRERVLRRLGRCVLTLLCVVSAGSLIVTLFGDNLRQLFGASAGGLAGSPNQRVMPQDLPDDVQNIDTF